MSSYFDYFCKNIENDKQKSSTTEFIKGTCYSMCPSEEITFREKENLVHVLEVLGPIKKHVKCYSRSAADTNMAIPRLLRPYTALKKTIEHLLLDVTRRNDVTTAMLYDFINDRLRSVRQDMTIQRLPPEECITLLEPMVRFYVYFGYKLCECPNTEFDPVLNKKYLLECLKWFLSCSDLVENSEKSSQINNLSSFMSNLEIQNRYMKNFTCDRPLMESLYILCNLDDVHPLFRYLSLPQDIKSDPVIKLSYQIAIANMKGNYITVCKLTDQLCPLTHCAICLHLPVLQRQALKVISHAYSSKQLVVPVAALSRWLRFANDADVIAACRHYGLNTEGNTVRFNKADFKTDVVTLQPKKIPTNIKLNMDIENVFTYSTKM